MKKIKLSLNSAQLKLFDNFTEQINNDTHGRNDIQENTGRQGEDVRSEERPGSRHESGTGGLGSEATFWPVERNEPHEVYSLDDGQKPSSIPEQAGGRLPVEDGPTHTERLAGNRSEGSGMVEPDGGSRYRRPPLEGTAGISAAVVVNYHSTEGAVNYTSFNKKVRYEDNLNALSLLALLDNEKRQASTAEQTTLAKYCGFGGLKEILLNPANSSDWKTASDKALLPYVEKIYSAFEELDRDGSEALLQSAKRSILSAHYTAFPIINAIWDTVELAGFKGGNILEPSAGIGNFLAAMPEEIATRSNVTAIEMDNTTGKVLQHLFPTAETHINGFEKLKLPETNFDLIISNIPFGDTSIYDQQLAGHRNKSFAAAADNIHNYFFAKSIMLAKPGAMIAFITSRYTLDSSTGSGIRNLMKDTCKFEGAIRLPDNAFKANAGTEAVADIIFLRKFNLGEEKTQKHYFEQVRTIPFTDANNQARLISYNEYFHNNPSHLLGQVAFGGQYRDDEFNLKGNPSQDLYEAITNLAIKIFSVPVFVGINADIIQSRTNMEAGRFLQMGDFDSIGNVVILEDGTAGIIGAENHIDEELDKKVLAFGINPNNIRYNTLTWADEQRLESAGFSLAEFRMKVVEPVKINKADLPRLQLIVPIRSLMKELLHKEVFNFNEHSIEKTRRELNQAYKNFTLQYGNLLHPDNKKAIGLDVDSYIIQSLEHKDKVTGKISPADILSKRTINPIKEVTKADNVQDAITLSLQRYGRLQMNYVAELLHRSYAEIIASQTGSECLIFINEAGEHLTRDEYLSGNVVDKLSKAREIVAGLEDTAEIRRWENNIIHLEKVQPKPIPAVEIYCPLQTRWMPKQYIQDFLAETYQLGDFNLHYSKVDDLYSVKELTSSAKLNEISTARRNPAWILNHALNGIEPIVTFIVRDENDNERTVVDADDTQLAKEQYRKVKAAWDDWKFNDMARRENIAAIYNKTYNSTVLRNFDGRHCEFPGLTNYFLRSHQKDAVFRNMQCVGGINDHIVGAGKTLVQICTAMELRRLAIANKPLIIGLKSQVPQLYTEFKKAYPLAKILFPTEKDFAKDKRRRLLSNIATNDWDCIILSHDQFNLIRQPVHLQQAMIEELTAEIHAEINGTSDKQELKRLQSRLYKYEQKIAALQDIKKDDQVLDFGQLGIDFLMVDESQQFKNLEFTTTKRNVRGLGNPAGSKKAFNLLVACRHLQQLHQGDKGILFCSGTTISNTMAELYLLFKFLRPNKMKELGFTSFDRWASNFANDYSDLEYYMGKFKEVHRFREFTNLPELVTMYRELADVRNNTNLVLDKPRAEHSLVKILPSETQLDQIEKLQSFIDTKGIQYADELGLTAGYDSQRKMNPSFAILAINYAKKLSLDPRLISISFAAGTKLDKAVENIAELYDKTTHFKGVQLVFCDLGTPKSNNPVDNLYNFLEADTNPSDMRDIFGEAYFELAKKPNLQGIKEKAAGVLNLSLQEVDYFIVEANTATRFNVYDEVKRLLVQRGLLADSIAFIHDYNTRKQKEALFAAVNAGDIRVVIGSTTKLGTGVNVQERCIAAHHLDISWKSSDIEQRNGRLERQGNIAAKEFFSDKVLCFYYATERTLDASMYNIVSQKAKFIAQLKTTSNPEVRVIKDIDEEIDMGSMAAELSGDPIFKEKAGLQKRINELSQLERSFQQKKFSTEYALKDAKKLKQFYEYKIDALTRNIPTLTKLPRDEKGNIIFSGKVDSIHYDKVSDFGKALVDLANKTIRLKPVGTIFNLAELWGFKVIGQVQFGGTSVARQIVSSGGDRIGEEKVVPQGEMAAGLQIRDSILNMPEELERATSRSVAVNDDIVSYSEQLEKTFPYKEELDAKRERLIEVDKRIIGRSNEQRQKNSPEILKTTPAQMR